MTTETTGTTAPRPGRCPLWIKLALVISLVLNVAVIGVVAGQMMKGERKSRGTAGQIRWILEFVPEARKAEAKALFDARRDEIRDLYRSRDRTMDGIIAAMRAEPFAPETLSAAIRQRDENSMARRMIIEEELVKLLTAFTQAERATFADRLEEKLAARRKRKRNRE